jgi:hypothetical protein
MGNKYTSAKLYISEIRSWAKDQKNKHYLILIRLLFFAINFSFPFSDNNKIAIIKISAIAITGSKS